MFVESIQVKINICLLIQDCNHIFAVLILSWLTSATSDGSLPSSSSSSIKTSLLLDIVCSARALPEVCRNYKSPSKFERHHSNRVSLV